MSLELNFYGVRGSIPTPLTGKQIEEKITNSLRLVHTKKFGVDSFEDDLKYVQKSIPFNIRSTYGGNTTCVELKANDEQIIFDMGTGMRELGKAMIPQIIANKGVEGTILQSHLHWDHIQGFPFWAPLFMPRKKFKNSFMFYGGKSWDAQLEVALQGQMNPPVFPVNLEELRHTAMNMEFRTIWDGWQSGLILARKLFHPQETFGYRITRENITIAFTTDHEPYAGNAVPDGLRELIDGVDLLITDCQYSHENYIGKKDGIQKLSWGHSYPEYIAMIAKECNVKKIITTHHDPGSADRDIEIIADTVEAICDIPTEPAYESMKIKLA